MVSEEQKAAIKKAFDFLKSLSPEELRASIEARASGPLALTLKELFEREPQAENFRTFERILTQEDWWKLGEKRFCSPPRMWRFRCPCGHVQCGDDFLKEGMTEELAMDLVYKKCRLCGSVPEMWKQAIVIDNAVVPVFAYDNQTSEEQIKILNDFSRKLLDNQEPCPAKYTQVLIDNFKDLLG